MIIISDNNLIFHIAILCFNIFFISSCITHIVFVLNFHYKLPVISFFCLGGGGGGGGGGGVLSRLDGYPHLYLRVE